MIERGQCVLLKVWVIVVKEGKFGYFGMHSDLNFAPMSSVRLRSQVKNLCLATRPFNF